MSQYTCNICHHFDWFVKCLDEYLVNSAELFISKTIVDTGQLHIGSLVFDLLKDKDWSPMLHHLVLF